MGTKTDASLSESTRRASRTQTTGRSPPRSGGTMCHPTRSLHSKKARCSARRLLRVPSPGALENQFGLTLQDAPLLGRVGGSRDKGSVMDELEPCQGSRVPTLGYRPV